MCSVADHGYPHACSRRARWSFAVPEAARESLEHQVVATLCTLLKLVTMSSVAWQLIATRNQLEFLNASSALAKSLCVGCILRSESVSEPRSYCKISRTQGEFCPCVHTVLLTLLCYVSQSVCFDFLLKLVRLCPSLFARIVIDS